MRTRRAARLVERNDPGAIRGFCDQRRRFSVRALTRLQALRQTPAIDR